MSYLEKRKENTATPKQSPPVEDTPPAMLLEHGFKARNLSGGMLSRFHTFLLVN
jgi:hypothetical protein